VDLMEGLPRAARDRRDWNNALLYSVQSPPLVLGDLVIPPMSISSYTNQRAGPPGWIRAFDVRTGRRRWTFHTVPLPGEFGNDTWENGSWAEAGKVNPWPPLSADEELGYIYAPVATALPDHYGGHRPGDNLFADSLVCLDARTGKRVWHFQMVHHGLWDYDPPAAPNLLEIVVNGRRIKAVAQVTKQGFVFTFDRVTGAPVWPIVERHVAPSLVAGEASAPTQPIPRRPAPFEYQGVTEDDLVDFTPAIRAEALSAVEGFTLGALYTPPTLEGTIQRPGIDGGANWTGAAVDPESGVLYVPSRNAYSVVQLRRPGPGDGAATLDYIHAIGARTPRMASGLPLLKPPYSRVTAIDMNTGEHLWMRPLGDGGRYRGHPALRGVRRGALGGDPRPAPLVTKTMLVLALAGGGRNDGPRLVAYDTRSGRELGWTALPAPALGAPMTYLVGGRQFIAVTVMGDPPELIAYALP
jgi:quinoprotein glucose dehydrogenase